MDKSEVDVVGVYCPDTDECYYVRPADHARSVTLRVAPSRTARSPASGRQRRSAGCRHRCASLGKGVHMPKKKTLLAGALAFASSRRGRKMMADARTKYDTPENRRKVGDAIGQLRKKRGSTTA